MSAPVLEQRTLSVVEAARILNAALKDKTYRKTPVGKLVHRYLRWFRNEWGATQSSHRDYEATLARMSLHLGDKQPLDVDIEDLRAVIDLWSDRTARTRAKVTSVIRSFWEWAEDEGHVPISPARKIRRPRAARHVAELLPLDARPSLLTLRKHPRDRLAMFCLLSLGLRRGELADVQVRDFDAGRGRLRIRGKGQKERIIPLRGPILAELGLYLVADLPHRIGRPPEPDDFLLYPVRTLADGKGPELELRRRFVAEPKKKPSPQSVHRWWYRQLQDAGMVGQGVTSGMNMHRARHTFATELRRVAGIDAASHALGHADLSTTLGIYGHRDDSDLEDAMDRYALWLERGNKERTHDPD